ncbi:hypothetical protein ACQR0V_07495 [Bradyrhizobium sp. HKCCYLS2058]|uniref:hypothetical protein n=1 Tax=Bradyrhizobium TaxID=374 RepID=UPI002916218A|nr:hypothetical protein [Bradyrhizobium sp. SZCCHNRI1009]
MPRHIAVIGALVTTIGRDLEKIATGRGLTLFTLCSQNSRQPQQENRAVATRDVIDGSALARWLKLAIMTIVLPAFPALLVMSTVARADDRTGFRVGEIDGGPVARIDVRLKTKKYPGMLRCLDQSIALYIVDRDGAVPPPLRNLKDRPAELQDAKQRTLKASATYLPGKTAKDGVMLFKVEGLKASSFAGTGLMLWDLAPPDSADLSATADKIIWADTVTNFTFVIRADNGEQVLPTVLKSCGVS